MWDAKVLVTIAIFVVTQVAIALVFGTKVGVKVDTIMERLKTLEGKFDKELVDLRANIGRMDRTVSNIEGRLAGTRKEP